MIVGSSVGEADVEFEGGWLVGGVAEWRCGGYWMDVGVCGRWVVGLRCGGSRRC